MSRVGKHTVVIPASVTMSQERDVFFFKGKLGESCISVPDCVNVCVNEHGLDVRPNDETSFARAMWGTVQRNLTNAIKGVSDGFCVTLDLVGVGYKALVNGQTLILQLGFSHDVEYLIPEGVLIKCEKPTQISITSNSKQLTGSIAARLRSYRPPEPYKGKGVIRAGEFVVRKEGKKK
ncbi:MAG: 50S ribosomal protein L6 [Holosporales bacterium]|jgi:large subunit ribosomal protein L6|nr:50S ribosomal protein L6 [Holosporales bacterium]